MNDKLKMANGCFRKGWTSSGDGVALLRNSDFFFWKRGPKKVWIGQQKFDFSAKVEYLTIRSEYEYGSFFPAGTLGNVKVVKLWKRVWFLPDFCPIFVWFSLKMGSDLGPNLEMLSLI